MEKGRDGVGDYTRLLAFELIKQGHKCSILALMDKFVKKPIEDSETKDIIHDSIQILRLPFDSGIKFNSRIAKEFVIRQKPDWVSIQYVPFAFNKRGLPINLGESIKSVLNEAKVHILFHEMWTGISKISPIKHKILGFFQIKIAKDLLNRCNPNLITSTNKLYNLVLEKKKIKSSILTLFGNIEIASFKSSFYINNLASFDILLKNRSEWVFIGLFGTIHPNGNLEIELENQFINAISKKMKLAFISIGRIGESGLLEFFRLKKLFENKIRFINIGEVSDREASLYIQMMDFAISSTPAQHIGKSGVYASLKLHQLKTLLISNEILPEYEEQMNDWYSHFINQSPNNWKVSYIANKFSELLESTK